MSDLAKQEKKLSPLDAAMRPIIASSPNIAKLLPPGLNLDRFVMQIKVALNKNADLMKCTPSSLVGACLEAADLGLDPSGRLGSAYLIPFKGQVTLVPGYKGLIDLATRSGLVRSVNAYVVHKKDVFRERKGFLPEHYAYEPKDGESDDPDAWTKVWARFRMAGGGSESFVMTHREVMAIKAKAPGASSPKSPWNGTIFEQERMAMKTVLRRGLAYMPLSPTANWDKLARAIDMGDHGAVIDGEARQMAPLEDVTEGELINPETGEVTEPAPAPTQAENAKAKL